MNRNIIILLVLVTSARARAQELSLQEAITIAIKNNLSVRAAGNDVEALKQLRKSSFDLPKTDVTLLYGQYNSYAENDNNITISQTIPFTVLHGQATVNREKLESGELKRDVVVNDLVYNVRRVYNELQYAYARNSLLKSQDSIYAGFLKAACLRYQTGESNLLEKTAAETQVHESRLALHENEYNIKRLQHELRTLMNVGHDPEVSSDFLPIEFQSGVDSILYKENPDLKFMQQQIVVAQAEKKFQVARMMPDLQVGFFSQTLIGTIHPTESEIASSAQRFTGFQVGVSLPIWFVPYRARIRAAEYEQRSASDHYNNQQHVTRQRLAQALDQISLQQEQLHYYQQSALANAELTLRQASVSFREGEVNYTEYLFGLRNALNIKENYLRTVNNLNQAVNYFNYLTGVK